MSLLSLSLPRPRAYTGPAPISRRAHFRYPTSVRIDVREHRDDGSAAETGGVTANLSRGGALALLPEEPSIGEERSLLVRFTDEEGNVMAPRFTWATALRSSKVGGSYEVAIRFEQPLEQRVLHDLLLSAPPVVEGGGRRLRAASRGR